jgi:bromodomain-containing protein 7/9
MSEEDELSYESKECSSLSIAAKPKRNQSRPVSRKKAKHHHSDQDDDINTSDSEEYDNSKRGETKKSNPKRSSTPRAKKPTTSIDFIPTTTVKKGPIISDPAERQQKYLTFLSTITKHKNASPFMNPVSVNDAPDYFEVIDNPMDFTTLQQKIIDDEITTAEQLSSHILLIFDNCKHYNRPDSEYYKIARALTEFTKKRFSAHPEIFG